MKTISFEELYHREFYLSAPMAKPQNWHARGNVYDSLDKPKVSHTFLWFKGCSGTVTDSEGRTLEVAQNQLVYTAKGSRYRIHFHDTAPGAVDTVVVHFQMTEADGEELAAADHPVICIKNVDVTVADTLEHLVEEFKKSVVCTPEALAALYRIFATVCGKRRRALARKSFSGIQRGIELLETGSALAVSEIAALCGVSECYFRRLFREYSGDSPVEFRQKHRIEKAKRLLLSDEHLTVGEVAAELGFTDIYHFSKTFKRYVGVAPLAFVAAALQ